MRQPDSIDVPIGYINAGGRGTRLNGLFTPDPNTGIAKALLSIGNPDIKLVDHQIANLRQQNIENIVVASGDQPDVYEYIHDMYANDPSIVTTRSEVQLGTGGDLVDYVRRAEITQPLLVQNVDTILDIDLQAFSHQFVIRRQLGALASIALTLNKGVPNEGAYKVDDNDKVLYSSEFSENKKRLPKNIKAYSASSTGAVIVEAGFLKNLPWDVQSGQLSLYRNCLSEAWKQDRLYAYNNGLRFFRDVGTVATWLSSQADLELQSQLRYSYSSLTA